MAAFEGGELRFLAGDSSNREVVLALPFNRLVVKMVRVPADQDPVEFATPVLRALSPFPDESLSVSCETVRESEGEKVVLAAALPESAADDIGEALDAEKLSVVKIDALALGALRCLWGELGIGDDAEPKRRLVILRSPDAVTLIVLDGDQPASVRAITDDGDLQRETMLSLLEAEDFNGPRELAETIEREVAASDALVGILERASDVTTLDATPASWREVLHETRFKAKLVRNLSVVIGLWVLVMAVLFGVPIAYGFMTDRMATLCKGHSAQFKAVSDKKAKTELVRKYSDHKRGALELMRAVSTRLPEGVTLTKWDFDRDRGITLEGIAETSGAILDFNDAMNAMTAEDGEERIFKLVRLGRVTSQKDGQHFPLELGFEKAEENQ